MPRSSTVVVAAPTFASRLWASRGCGICGICIWGPRGSAAAVLPPMHTRPLGSGTYICGVACSVAVSEVRLLRENPAGHLSDPRGTRPRESRGCLLTQAFFGSSLKYCPPVQQDIESVLEIPQDIDQRQRESFGFTPPMAGLDLYGSLFTMLQSKMIVFIHHLSVEST